MALSLDYYLPGITSTDTHKRIQAYQDIIGYLNDPGCVIECDDLDQVIDGLCQWMNSSNYKIALNGLEILNIIVKRQRESFKQFVTSVLPAAIDRIGDSKEQVRDAAIQLVVRLAEASSAQYVLDRMTGAFTHKLWRVREGVMLCLQSCLNIHGAKSITLSKIVPLICKLLDDQNGSVRETAQNTLVDIYCHVGERVRTDLAKKGISQSKLTAIYAAFDDARDAGKVLASADAKDAALKEKRPSVTSIPSAGTVRRGSAYKTSSTTTATASGAVDEESFLTSFTEVPKVNFFSARELSDHITKIKDTLSDDKIDWEKRVDSLKMVRSLIINGALGYDDFLPQLRNLETCFQLSVKDLRSQIVREACVSIAYMSQQLGNKFDHFGEAVLPNLIMLISNTVKVMATSGIVCIQMLLQYTHSQRFVPVITGNLTSKSSTIRKYCLEFLEQMLHTWPTHPLERHIAILQESIKRGMNDADADARARSRKAYWGFANHFKEQADSLLSSLDSSKQKLLQQGQMSASSSSNSLNNATTLTRSGSITRLTSGLAKPRVRSTSIDRGTTGISGLTKRRPQTASTLGPSRVAKTPQKVEKTANGDSRTPGSNGRQGRTKSRIGVSQSQPSSRSSSPSSRLSYLTYQRSTERNMTGSRIPRSQGTSRETSPTRSSSRTRSGLTPQRVTQGGVLAQSILTKDAEQALASALLRTARRRSRTDTYDSDDNMSETSSICSDRSYGSYGRTSEDVAGILNNMSSGSWADRKDGLAQLQQLMQTTRLLNKLEVKKFTEIFTRMFHEPHNKVLCVFMEVLVDFIYIYKDSIVDWLHVLLPRLLTKLGAELLGSITMKIQRALDAVRDNFQYDHQFSVITKFIIDSTQTPSNKVRAGILNYLHSLIRMMDPSDLVISTDTKLAVTRIITWTSEPKSVDVRKSASAVIISLFDLNSPEFSGILSEIPKSFQETATRILHTHLKNTSRTDNGEVLTPRNQAATPGSGQASRSKSQQRRNSHRDQYETENMNPEEIYNSICQTTADIQNLSMSSKLDHRYDDRKMTKERDNTSQDSGIQSSMPDLHDGGHHGNQHPNANANSTGGYNPVHYQDAAGGNHGDGVNGGLDKRWMGGAEVGAEDDLDLEDSGDEDSDPLADILAELSHHSQRSKERSAALGKLKRIITDADTDYSALWDQHFKTVLFLLLEMLADEDPEFRVRAMNRLQDLILYHSARLENYVELVILRVMEAHKDSERMVQIAAEGCAPALGSVIQPEQSIRCLQDFIKPGEFPANYTAIKIQNKAVEKMSPDLLQKMLPEITPQLVAGCDHEETFVRKASVFCLVSIYMVVGEELTQWLKDLRGSKLKLLNLYITREQKKRATKTSGSVDDNSSSKSGQLNISPTTSEGALI